ncbi:hypothetical protein [Leptolyngbya sp. AN10]|uniref:hypothetical protein n=1 Tax=Leptolyngbya sp. AN10 TaxID=3423365 RepID=UPI003D31C99B
MGIHWTERDTIENKLFKGEFTTHEAIEALIIAGAEPDEASHIVRSVRKMQFVVMASAFGKFVETGGSDFIRKTLSEFNADALLGLITTIDKQTDPNEPNLSNFRVWEKLLDEMGVPGSMPNLNADINLI